MGPKINQTYNFTVAALTEFTGILFPMLSFQRDSKKTPDCWFPCLPRFWQYWCKSKEIYVPTLTGTSASHLCASEKKTKVSTAGGKKAAVKILGMPEREISVIANNV
jgi:hypothetical protein